MIRDNKRDKCAHKGLENNGRQVKSESGKHLLSIFEGVVQVFTFKELVNLVCWRQKNVKRNIKKN